MPKQPRRRPPSAPPAWLPDLRAAFPLWRFGRRGRTITARDLGVRPLLTTGGPLTLTLVVEGPERVTVDAPLLPVSYVVSVEPARGVAALVDVLDRAASIVRASDAGAGAALALVREVGLEDAHELGDAVVAELLNSELGNGGGAVDAAAGRGYHAALAAMAQSLIDILIRIGFGDRAPTVAAGLARPDRVSVRLAGVDGA